MRRLTFACFLVTLVFSAALLVHASELPQKKTASTHPIQYYLSLPEGWTAEKKWSVVVVIESAERDFLAAVTAFAQARQKQRFILVAPLVVTNGGSGYRNVPTYDYSPAVWDTVQVSGAFKFDMDGITAIMQDVVKQYGGEEKYFVAGLEAAGHTIWGILFNHPEAVRGAALVCPNYLGRWVDEAHISSAPERDALPIRNFVGTKDELCSSGHPIYTQMQKAIDLAQAHGYKNVSLTRVEGKGHERLADEVLAYFSSLVDQSGNVLDRRADLANLDNVIVAQAVLNTLLDANVPGGVARISNCKQELTHRFSPPDRSVRAVLDSIVSTDPAYRWELEGDAINVVPSSGLPPFLTSRISRFEIADVESPEEALSKLLALPELKQAQLALGPRAVQGGAYPFCPNGCPPEEKKKISVSLKDVTVREALNTIARAHGNAVWSFWQSDCGRKVFSLDIAAR